MRIKEYWNKYKAYIVAGAVALAYLIGIKKGKTNEKARQTKTVLQNVQRANKARDSVANNPDIVQRLHKKYNRR